MNPPVFLIACVPTRGSLTAETVAALYNHADGFQIALRIVARKPVDVARNELAAQALAIADATRANMPGAEVFVLWIDDDAWWPPGTIAALVELMRMNPQADVLACRYSTRRAWGGAVQDAFRLEPFTKQYKFGPGCVVPMSAKPLSEPIDEVSLTGFHLTLMRPDVLARVGAEPFTIVDSSVGEDVAFGNRLAACGARSFVANFIVAAHVDREGDAFVPYGPPHRIVEQELVPIPGTRPADPTKGFAYERADGWKKRQEPARSYGRSVDESYARNGIGVLADQKLRLHGNRKG